MLFNQYLVIILMIENLRWLQVLVKFHRYKPYSNRKDKNNDFYLIDHSIHDLSILYSLIKSETVWYDMHPNKQEN